MDCAQDGARIFFGFSFEKLGDAEAGDGIQTGGWLVQEKQGWFPNHLITNRSTLPLGSIELFRVDLGVRARIEPKSREKSVHVSVNLAL